MKYLFALNHPAHYHLFKNSFNDLVSRGHSAVFAIRDKDILAELLIAEKKDFIRVAGKRNDGGTLSVLIGGAFNIISQGISLYKLVRKFRPDLMIGTDYSITHTGKILNIPSVVFNEDDYAVNRLFCNLAYPFAETIVSPDVCDAGRFEWKKTGYPGYQKLAYLHPEVFTPDPGVVKKYIPDAGKYFLLRLVNYTAGHDIEKRHGGITGDILRRLISVLSPEGKVLISSEAVPDDEFKPYILKADVRDIHHLVASSSLFIADSQSMIVEASMLGTPSIRFNSFVGTISVLEELEKKYRLTEGILNTDPELLLKTTAEMASDNRLPLEYSIRRDEMLKEKIKVSPFFTWFIENYPLSKQKLNSDPGFINQFR
jgi:uncharacterized protein